MAVSVAHLDAGTTTTFPVVTASVSPSGEVLIFIQCGDANLDDVTGVSGCSLTWSQVLANTSNWGGGNYREFVWKGVGTATTGAITVTFDTNPGTVTYQVCDVTGHNTAGMVVQSASATGTSTTPSVTLSAFSDAGNATIGWCCAANTGAGAISVGTGFSLLDEEVRASFAVACVTEWRADNDTTVDATINASKTWYMHGFEIAVATATDPEGSLIHGKLLNGGLLVHGVMT